MISFEPAINAIREGNMFRLERILTYQPSLLNAKISDGRTLLRCAIQHKQLNIAKLLVSKGAKLEHETR